MPLDDILDGVVIDSRFQIVDERMIWTAGDLSFVYQYAENSKLWGLHVIKGGMPIVMKIDVAKAPYEDDSRVRDSKLRRSLEKIAGIDVDAAMIAFGEFGLYLMQNIGVVESYIDSITDTIAPDEIDEGVHERALEILKHGDPIATIMAEFHEHHIGDSEYGQLIVLAIASQHVKNTHGIHLTPSGASGKGKSHAGKTMLHLVPREWWLEGSLSPKSLFYVDIEPGIIIFSDDVTMDEDTLSIMRRSITGFTEPQEHRTVDANRKGVVLTIPERIIWITASVTNDFDDQTRNRMIDIPVDESPETDELVFLKQVEDAKTGHDEYPETDGVKLCREIYRIIKDLDPFSVAIPFADDIIWKKKSNRRNFDVFKDFVKSYALIRHLQRERDKSGVLQATVADFYDAQKLYLTRARGEDTKMLESEQKVVRAIEDHMEYGEIEMKTLISSTGIPQATLHIMLHGRKDRSTTGLLGRKGALIYHHEEIRETANGSRRKVNLYGVTNSNPLGHFSDVVSLKSDSAEKSERVLDETSGTDGMSDKSEHVLSQLDRMKCIDRFFREFRDKDGKHVEIGSCSLDGINNFVPAIVKQCHVNEAVAHRSLMEYCKERGWI